MLAEDCLRPFSGKQLQGGEEVGKRGHTCDVFVTVLHRLHMELSGIEKKGQTFAFLPQNRSLVVISRSLTQGV